METRATSGDVDRVCEVTRALGSHGARELADADLGSSAKGVRQLRRAELVDRAGSPHSAGFGLGRRGRRPDAAALRRWGRDGGIASGVARRSRGSKRWKTITFAVPPEDYAQLTVIVQRDGTRYSTLAREALQNYLTDVDEASTL